MKSEYNDAHLSRGISTLAVAIGLLYAGTVSAQTTPAPSSQPPVETTDGDQSDIVVTGSRIDRAGFQQPTPTTVLGSADIQLAARANLQQVLTELPQVRNSNSPTVNAASTNTGTASIDLRGLGSGRTLTLINGRRFVGDGNLNFVPTNLVDRVELVTGGASAAWGSDAVAGVVNIILNDKLKGLSLGANTGISSRGDGMRYGFDGSFGTSFADGKGHLMVGAEYVRDKGIGNSGMDDRPWFGAGLVNIGGGKLELRANQPNLIVAGSSLTYGGTVLNGALAGQVFNNDGTLRAQQQGDPINLYRTVQVSSPVDRISSYARLSYDVGKATIWVDGAYGQANSDQPFIIDPAQSVLVVSIAASNPFLSNATRQQLANAGQTSFLLGRYSRDTFGTYLKARRQYYEGAIGIDGTFGGSWKYGAHYSHGEAKTTELVLNSAIPANFARALNAVQTPGGIVCAVNADATTTNDDPACAPFNPFGEGNASAAATNYVRGTQSNFAKRTLDSLGVELQGDPFSLWAGPITVAIGGEARWEKQQQENGALDKQGTSSIFGSPLYRSPLNGGFNVKEAFAETVVPLLAVDKFKVEFNGAARYSDYSRSGGIWSWKLGGTAHILDGLLLRATRSRDIRAPSITELFNASGLTIRQVVDRATPPGSVNGVNGYNSNPNVTIFNGGNPNLVPEISKTWTVGGSFSPSFIKGFSVSVDYYDINISGAIAAPTGDQIVAACAAGNADACSRIDRDPASKTITVIRATNANISTLRTNGFDIEASYALPLSRISSMPGTLRFRALATYVHHLQIAGTENAGSVGDTVINGVPHWRANFSLGYTSDAFGIDLRARYVGGGKFDAAQPNIVNNDVSARAYFDLGMQFKVANKFTLFGNIRNLFDRDPPLVIQLGGRNYDTIGRYFTTGVRLNF